MVKGIFYNRGPQTLTTLWGSAHQGPYKQQSELTFRTGKDDLKDDELETGPVHAVFAEKTLAKPFETSYTESDHRRSSKHAAAWDHHHVILHVVGSIQTLECLLSLNQTLRIRNMKYPCLRYEPKQIFTTVFK